MRMNLPLISGISLTALVGFGMMDVVADKATQPTKQERFRESVYRQNDIWCAKPQNRHYCKPYTPPATEEKQP